MRCTPHAERSIEAYLDRGLEEQCRFAALDYDVDELKRLGLFGLDRM
jgi:hypothetical protein